MNPLNANFEKKEFQDLWGRINRKKEAKYEEIKKEDAFVLKESVTDHLTGSVHSDVKYDLIGKLAENTKLTRHTIRNAAAQLG